MIWEQFEMFQRSIATGTIIEVHTNEPPILYFSGFASDASLTFCCPNHTGRASQACKFQVIWQR